MKQYQKVAGLLLHDAVSLLKQADKRIEQLERENHQLQKELVKVKTRGMWRMEKQQAINIAVTCVLASGLDTETKKEVIESLRMMVSDK